MFETIKEKLKILKVVPKKGFSGQVMLLASSALALVVAGVVMSYGAKITNDVSTEFTAGSTAKAAADNSTEGINKLAKNLPLVGTVLAGVVIIAIILAGFGGFLGGRGGR